jgi:hypothetical protein
MAVDEYELLRERFRPQRTRVLFIGESRPASGAFFYKGDSTLERYTRMAFDGVPAAPDTPASIQEFLARFKSSGFYLVDLCVEPVNALARGDRKKLRRKSEARLASTIKALRSMAAAFAAEDSKEQRLASC